MRDQPINEAALAADVLCLFIPGITGGGPAARVGIKVGELAIETAIRVPLEIRAGQTLEKLFQTIIKMENDGQNSGDFDSSTSSDVVNITGKSYPEIIDPRTNKPIQAPPDNLGEVPYNQRVSWTSYDRAEFIKQWIEKGYSEPEGGWELYDIHQIIPREYGGTNDFENLVPVLREVHQQVLNKWWFYY